MRDIIIFLYFSFVFYLRAIVCPRTPSYQPYRPTGSLEAAIKKEPLDRKEYLENIRSNVPTSSKEGVDKRHAIYDEYSQYRGWKHSKEKFDIHDVILQLIRLNLPQLFDSAYLDEIQDFSYAAIYLICTIAGKDLLVRYMCLNAALIWFCV